MKDPSSEDDAGARCSETCALHVIVPVQAKRQAKIAAEQSGMRFKDFIARLLVNSTPLMSETNVSSRSALDA